MEEFYVFHVLKNRGWSLRLSSLEPPDVISFGGGNCCLQRKSTPLCISAFSPAAMLRLSIWAGCMDRRRKTRKHVRYCQPIALRWTLIVGFLEKLIKFDDRMSFCRQMGFSKMHVLGIPSDLELRLLYNQVDQK